jgi:uncharacterized protein (TIGR02444 family)
MMCLSGSGSNLMSLESEFPEHPFWGYSLKLYARPEVSQACLELQDGFDLDVNMVLFCVWAGAEGPGRLTGSEILSAVTRSGRWQREVVRRLRYVRRTLKHDALGASDELVQLFRPEVQALELAAEHVEQLLLAEIVPLERTANGFDIAAANLLAYFEAVGLAPGGNSRDEILLILARAFPGVAADQLNAAWPG